MSWIDYVVIFAVSVLGMILQMLLKIKSIKEKAKNAKVVFSTKEYLKDDWLSHGISLVTIVMFMFFVNELANIGMIAKYLKIAFAFVGYSSADIASRLFSVVNKRVNNAIDYKATIADEVNGTTGTNTPTK